MPTNSSRQIGKSASRQRALVEEYPLRLHVNGRELATLTCSPHQLNFLVAGFCYQQGFINSLDDIEMLGICSEFGHAEIRLKRQLPEKLALTLTSGCGSGISFNPPAGVSSEGTIPSARFSKSTLLTLMQQLDAEAERYRRHGGIHSAAVGNHKGMLLFAEDLGRHNCLDRLAGEALFKDLTLQSLALVTSGRISTEMVAKAARLNIALLASKTSPTDKAAALCEQLGITLIGYLRGQQMEVFSHPQRLLA